MKNNIELKTKKNLFRKVKNSHYKSKRLDLDQEKSIFYYIINHTKTLFQNGKKSMAKLQKKRNNLISQKRKYLCIFFKKKFP